MKNSDYIAGITFAPFVPAGKLYTEESKESLRVMKEKTSANFITLVPNALQNTPQSETIDYTSGATVPDDELVAMINYAHSLGLKVILKPTVNCKNGTWRAHINFFDEDVPCEPKWGNWFASYEEFQLHFARIAEKTGTEMFIPGCEMVMTEHREKEWRHLIAEIRKVYSGIVSYNTDKYQEHNVKWWDCVDYISSSGYYPVDKWEEQLDRIEKVVKKFNKPFFFAEAGCRSAVGSKFVPNNWEIRAESDLEGQSEWYEAMLGAIEKRDWVGGIMAWSWGNRLYKPECCEKLNDYEIYLKPAQDTINKYFSRFTK